jgi:hypothetical protein
VRQRGGKPEKANNKKRGMSGSRRGGEGQRAAVRPFWGLRTNTGTGRVFLSTAGTDTVNMANTRLLALSCLLNGSGPLDPARSYPEDSRCHSPSHWTKPGSAGEKKQRAFHGARHPAAISSLWALAKEGGQGSSQPGTSCVVTLETIVRSKDENWVRQASRFPI